MALEYIGLKQINGPLVVLDGVHGASYEEMVKIKAADGSERQGRIIEIHGDLAVVQVFEGTDGLSLTNTTTQMTGKPMTMPAYKGAFRARPVRERPPRLTGWEKFTPMRWAT